MGQVVQGAVLMLALMLPGVVMTDPLARLIPPPLTHYPLKAVFSLLFVWCNRWQGRGYHYWHWFRSMTRCIAATLSSSPSPWHDAFDCILFLYLFLSALPLSFLHGSVSFRSHLSSTWFASFLWLSSSFASFTSSPALSLSILRLCSKSVSLLSRLSSIWFAFVSLLYLSSSKCYICEQAVRVS